MHQERDGGEEASALPPIRIMSRFALDEHGQPQKTYIGDGIYIEFVNGVFNMTTENGISITNTIVLEPIHMVNVERYYQAARQSCRSVKDVYDAEDKAADIGG